MFEKIGWILVGLNLLMAVSSGLFFLFVEGMGPVSWLVVNTCALAIILFAAGFYWQRAELIGFSLPWLFFYGAGGLLVFKWGWSLALVVPQVSHIIMATTVIYGAVYVVFRGNWKYAVGGFVLGLIAVFLFFPWQQDYQRRHPKILKHLHFREGYGPLKNG